VRGEAYFRDGAGTLTCAFQGEVEAITPAYLGSLGNPYVLGKPLSPGSAMFFGRASEMAFIQRALESGESGSVVMLTGQRRTGKTSLLRQLEIRFAGDYLPVFVDGQGAMTSDPKSFFRGLAREATPREWGGSDALATGLDLLLEEAERSDRKLMLLIDEFDELEEKVRRRHLTQELFGPLRSFLQHRPNFTLVLCGAPRLETMAGEHDHFLLNQAAHQRLGVLEHAAAAEVITDPLQKLGIGWNDVAVEAAVDFAGCQPYLLQLLGYRLVEQCVETGDGAIRLADVMHAADHVVEQGEIHLRYLWDTASEAGRKVLRQLAGGVSFDSEEMRKRTGLSRKTLAAATKTLQESDLIEQQECRYRMRVGLLGRWIGLVE
jgi:hypothetical protein